MEEAAKEPAELEPLGPVVGELLSAFGGESRNLKSPGAKRRELFSPDQVYLTQKLNKCASKPLSWGGLTKLNQTYGLPNVTAALRDCALVLPESPYAYITSIMKGQEPLFP